MEQLGPEMRPRKPPRRASSQNSGGHRLESIFSSIEADKQAGPPGFDSSS